MTDSLNKLHALLQASLQDSLVNSTLVRDELTLYVGLEALVKTLSFLKENPLLQFRQLIDICGVDYPDRSPRFEVVYHLLSMKHNQRLRVKARTDESTPVPSVTDLYRCANWWEREAWDMYGIPFENHPDLRRILTDYDFEGFPLRKDFPLTGYKEVRYDENKKRVIYEPVTLPQDFRAFDFLSPWEGLNPYGAPLPDDEKAEQKTDKRSQSE